MSGPCPLLRVACGLLQGCPAGEGKRGGTGRVLEITDILFILGR